MNMNVSELINLIVEEWAYRVNDGMPNPKNPIHLKELGIVLSEMGLSHIKNDLVENLLTEKGKTPEPVKEEEKSFSNPILNKKVSYKDKEGNQKDGIVGNLLRQPEGTPARDAAEKVLPPEGSPERDALNQELGGEGGKKGEESPEDAKDKGAAEKEKQQQAQAMFDPKVDPAMAQRLDKEKEIQAQIAKDAEKASADSKKEVEPEKESGGFNPIPTQDVQKEIPQADPETFGGASDIPDGIDKKDLEKFNTDISKVQQMVADAKAKGEKAPDINLCQITVPGTNLYCDDNLGIPRDQMPQFKGKPVPGSKAEKMPLNKDGEVDTEPVFREMLKEKGIKTTQTEVPADKLKATQSELGGDKVVGMMGALEKDPNHPGITGPIYVSRDGFVIDGHHRWAAIAAYNAKYPDKQIPMKCEVIDMDIKDAIPMCNKFAEDIGIAAKKQGETTGKAGEEQPNEKPKKVSSFTKMTDKIKEKISKWQKDEKEYFENGYYKAGSEARRTLGQAIKDKAAGAWKAVKDGFKHEVKEFKTAGVAVGKLFSEAGGWNDLSHHEKDALKAVGVKIVTTALFGAALGGLSYGAVGFAKHVAIEFVPHVVAETFLKGAGRAALFADAEGEAEMDAKFVKFAEMIADGLENMDISEEQMEAMVDSYNEKKEKGEDNTEAPQMKEELLPMVDSLIESIIAQFIKETNPISKVSDVLKQKVKYKDEKGEHEVQVDTALKYKNSKKAGQLQAYNAAVKLLKKAGVSADELGATEKKPKEIPGQGLGFRKTKEKDLETPAKNQNAKPTRTPQELEAIRNDVFGNKKGIVVGEKGEADNEVKNNMLKYGYKGYLKATGKKPAPGSEGSAFNEIISGTAAKLLQKHPDLSEEELTRVIVSQYCSTALGKEQTETSTVVKDLPNDLKKVPCATKALICARSARKKYDNSINRANALTQKGLFGKQRNLETYYGAEESLDAQVKAIQSANKVLTPHGDVVDKEDAIAFVLMGGGGANPSDTATFVTDEKRNLMLQFHSDKTSTGDIQDNSTLKKEIDKKLEQVDGMVSRGIITDREAKKIKSIILAHAKDVEEVESTYNEGVSLVAKNLIKNNSTKGASFKEQIDVIVNGGEPTILKNIDAALFGKKGLKPEAIKHLPKKYLDKSGNPKPGLTAKNISLEDKYLMIRAVAAEGGGEAYNKVVVKVSKMLVSKAIREGKKPVSGIDVNNVLSFQRRKVVESHFKQFREMDKTKINYRGKKVGLGTYLQGIDVVDSFHLKLMDGDTRKYEKGKPESLVFSTLDVNMGGTVVNGDVLRSCFGVNSSREFLQNFSVEEKATLTYEFTEKQAIAKLAAAGIKKPTPEQIQDARNVTGMNIFTYAVDKKSGEVREAGYRTYRPKSGKSGRTNTTMQYSPAMQECFKSKNK